MGSNAPPLEPLVPRIYDVYTGVFCERNPGPHAIAMVTLSDGQRDEWGQRLPIPELTTPRSWLEVIDRALIRVNRPDAIVCIHIRASHLIRALMFPDRPQQHTARIVEILQARPRTRVEWLPKKNNHPEMERAHALAFRAFRVGQTPSRR